MTIYVIHNPLSFPQPKCFRRSRLPRRAVLQLHLTPPTSSPHGIPSPTPTVTVASTNASSPSSSLSSALTNIPIPSIIDTLNFTAHPPPTYSVNGRLPTLQRSSKAPDIKKKSKWVFRLKYSSENIRKTTKIRYVSVTKMLLYMPT